MFLHFVLIKAMPNQSTSLILYNNNLPLQCAIKFSTPSRLSSTSMDPAAEEEELPPFPQLQWRPSVRVVNEVPVNSPTNREDTRHVAITLETNEDGLLPGRINEEDGSLRFELSSVNFDCICDPRMDDIERLVMLLIPTPRKPGAEWNAVVQARIYIAKKRQPLQMAMTEVLEVGNKRPALQLCVEPDVENIKIELRFIYQHFYELPTFKNGDLSIFFSRFEQDQDVVHVDKALMALFAPKLVSMLLPPNESMDLPFGVDRPQFEEMLYQIYSPHRPMTSVDIKALCSAATKLGSKLLMWPICQHIVHDNQLDFQDKVKKAARLGLEDAVHQLCYDAIKSGEWTELQRYGFDACTFFGPEIYSQMMTPAIIEAMKDKMSQQPEVRACLYEEKHPRSMPNFDSQDEASNPFNVPLLVDGKLLFVNRGLLQINGCLDNMNIEGGHHTFRVSAELKQALERSQLSLQRVALPGLHLLYGTVHLLESSLLRASVILASDHGMRAVVDQLEKILVDELVDGPEKLLSHLLLAEKYKLKNLERKSLWRLECKEYQNMGLAMLELADYYNLSPLFKQIVEDRLCNGWAITSEKLAKGAPSSVNAFRLQLLATSATAEPIVNVGWMADEQRGKR